MMPRNDPLIVHKTARGYIGNNPKNQALFRMHFVKLLKKDPNLQIYPPPVDDKKNYVLVHIRKAEENIKEEKFNFDSWLTFSQY